MNDPNDDIMQYFEMLLNGDLPVTDDPTAMDLEDAIKEWYARTYPMSGKRRREIENEVDGAFDRLGIGSPRAKRGKPGRPKELADVARYVNDLRREGKTWDELTTRCKQMWPDRVSNREQLRQLYRRYYPSSKK